MIDIFKDRINTKITWTIAFSLLLTTFIGCKAPTRIFHIGVVGLAIKDTSDLKGFLDGMSDLGYIEGRDIKYIYMDIPVLEKMVIDEKIKEILAEDIDMLIIKGNEVSIRAKELLKGTDVPALFIGSYWPVENGLVESLGLQGGNLTGVKAADSMSKSLEWLVKIIPDAKKIWVPYDPEDRVAASEIIKVEEAGSQLGVELVLFKAYPFEEAVAGIENLPKDIDAILRIPSAVLDQQNKELSRIAIERRIPMGAAIPLDESVLVTFVSNFQDAGKKTTRLAQQILQGAKPADIPVETSEIRLIINLRTAEEIGLHVPDDFLAQARTIIR